MRTKAHKIISLIQKSLSPDLLKEEYKEHNKTNPLFGHCYVASEALFHALGGFSSPWRPFRARDDDKVVHWWLENNDGVILDPTADQYQYLDIDPPYGRGRRAGFLTREPSKRACSLLNKLNFNTI